MKNEDTKILSPLQLDGTRTACEQDLDHAYETPVSPAIWLQSKLAADFVAGVKIQPEHNPFAERPRAKHYAFESVLGYKEPTVHEMIRDLEIGGYRSDFSEKELVARLCESYVVERDSVLHMQSEIDRIKPRNPYAQEHADFYEAKYGSAKKQIAELRSELKDLRTVERRFKEAGEYYRSEHEMQMSAKNITIKTLQDEVVRLALVISESAASEGSGTLDELNDLIADRTDERDRLSTKLGRALGVVADHEATISELVLRCSKYDDLVDDLKATSEKCQFHEEEAQAYGKRMLATEVELAEANSHIHRWIGINNDQVKDISGLKTKIYELEECLKASNRDLEDAKSQCEHYQKTVNRLLDEAEAEGKSSPEMDVEAALLLLADPDKLEEDLREVQRLYAGIHGVDLNKDGFYYIWGNKLSEEKDYMSDMERESRRALVIRWCGRQNDKQAE